jgi:hypothetical protein
MDALAVSVRKNLRRKYFRKNRIVVNAMTITIRTHRPIIADNMSLKIVNPVSLLDVWDERVIVSVLVIAVTLNPADETSML